MDNNPFDEITIPEQDKTEEAKLKAAYEKRDQLIHAVFYQTDQGKELLKMWRESMELTPVVRLGEKHDSFDIGIIQGTQDFVRNIFITCEKVERG